MYIKSEHSDNDIACSVLKKKMETGVKYVNIAIYLCIYIQMFGEM